MSGAEGEEHPGRMTLTEAAGLLRLPVESVEALVGAGYLRTTAWSNGPRFALGDLKAFLARNADDDDGGDLFPPDLAGLDDLDPQVLLDALGGRADQTARRALDVLITVFPEPSRWPLPRQARFVAEARARFEAIVAVAIL